MYLRQATTDDIARVASIQAESWRDAYASILDPAFLAGPIDKDLLELWSARLTGPSQGRRITVAVEAETLLGFVCVLADADPKWGALVDNLHVSPSARGNGIGAQLLRSAAAWLRDEHPHSAMHLWVFEENLLARQFYARLGGAAVEKSISPIPSARGASVLRFYWASTTEIAG